MPAITRQTTSTIAKIELAVRMAEHICIVRGEKYPNRQILQDHIHERKNWLYFWWRDPHHIRVSASDAIRMNASFTTIASSPEVIDKFAEEIAKFKSGERVGP